MSGMVEMELARIIINESSDQQFIFLREKGGQRQFPIVISMMEALAIDRFVKEQETPRPLTHELMNKVIGSLGANISRVEVTELKNGTFYANLVLQRDGSEIEVDARPSDAIALAIRNSSQIFVAEQVLEEVMPF
ncbi:MAG: bifunctional nuclease family protein [Planctomycetota bacterium]|nr:bifunctional nuclease family protein [Planctomycetota bacterium]